MKYSLYLISALVLISCVSAGHYHHPRPYQPYNHGSNLAFNDLESDLVYFGINFIFQQAANKFGVADNNVQVTLINDFGIKNWNNDWNLYWFNVDATNNDDASVDARFGVYYNHATGQKNMGAWSYHIHFYNNNNNVNVNENPIANEENNAEGVVGLNEENGFAESELGFEQGEGGANGEAGPGAESEAEFPVESEAEAGVSGEAESVLPVESEAEADVSGEAGSESALPVESEAEVEAEGESSNLATDFEDVPQDQQNDPAINSALEFGAAFIFNDAANNFGLSDFGTQVTIIESLQRRNAGNDHTQYSAHVQATNDDDIAVDTWFIVDVNNANQAMVVVGHWSYVILDNANEEAAVLEEEAILVTPL